MTKQEAINLIRKDGIYSQEVMDALQEPSNANQHNSNALNALKGDAKPKTGHWIKAKPWMLDNTSYKWECSECEKSERFRYNYCPNCGVRMESEG